MIDKIYSRLPAIQHSYVIEFVPGALKNEIYLKEMLGPFSKRFAIITDDSVAKIYGMPLEAALRNLAFEPHLFSFPAGEKYKTRDVKIGIENAMLEKGLGRDIVVIALGGGIVTDMAGFLAATYGRGVPLIVIPTTLLGMVDASIGGKNGVNTPQGKNLIGTLYQPKKIIVDILTLNTLLLNEIRNGIVEMIKHGLIADKHYFDFLFDCSKGILALDPSIISQAIVKSCQIKMEIVSEDEHESGKRHLLNFGHTFGHAIEKTTDYAMAHGEAVAIGLLAESYLSLLMGRLSPSSFKQILSIFECFGLPFKLPEKVTPEAMRNAMIMDKKSLKGQPRFTIIEDIGIPVSFEGSFCTTVDEDMLTKALNWMKHDLCSH